MKSKNAEEKTKTKTSKQKSITWKTQNEQEGKEIHFPLHHKGTMDLL